MSIFARLTVPACAVAAFLGASLPGQAPQHGALLVVTKQTHALAIVDGDSLTVVARIPIGEDPHEVIVGPDHRTAFVSNYGEGTLHTLARVDLVARKALPPVDLSPLVGPHGLYLHNDALWFTAEGSEALGTLDPSSGRITSVLGTGQLKTHLVWVSRDGAIIFASNASSATAVLYRRVEIQPTVVPGAPAPPASYTHSVWEPKVIPTGEGAEGFAVSPDEREVWVGDARGRLTAVDLHNSDSHTTFAAGIPGANRLRFTPDGRFVLITTHTGKDLVVFDVRSRKPIKRIPIEERGASNIQIEPNGHRAFVACPRDHYVAVDRPEYSYDDRHNRCGARARRSGMVAALDRHPTPPDFWAKYLL
jgi:DNA-binding beta-propeller fold protein YncE